MALEEEEDISAIVQEFLLVSLISFDRVHVIGTVCHWVKNLQLLYFLEPFKCRLINRF